LFSGISKHVTNDEVEVDPRLLACREPDALAPHWFENGELDVDPEIARCQSWRGRHKPNRLETTVKSAA